MTAPELLVRCRILGIDLAADPDGFLAWATDADPPAELLAELTENKVEILALIRSPFGNCGQCGCAADAKRRCWRCHDRPCVNCGRPTGSAFIQRCIACGHAFNGNRGDTIAES
jgi:hypothetical protein